MSDKSLEYLKKIESAYKKVNPDIIIQEHNLINDWISQILKSNKLEVEIVGGPIPTLDLNATAIRGPENERIIGVNAGLVGYIFECVNSFLSLLFTKNITQESFNDSALNVMLWTWGFIKNQNLGITKSLPLTNPKLLDLCEKLLHSAYCFILSHELAHFVLGHLDDKNTYSEKLNLSSSEELEFFSKSLKQEYEADRKGFEFTEKHHHQKFGKNDYSFLCSIYYIFGLLELTELIESHKNFNTHPPAIDRKKEFLKTYNHILTEEMKSINMKIDSFLDQVKSFVNHTKIFAESLKKNN